MALDPKHRQRSAAGELAELLPGRAHVGRGEAVVDEDQLRSGRS
jgi:hypothetical protein